MRRKPAICHFSTGFWAVAAGTLVFTREAAACSVCLGDPESPMVKGAVAGIIVMLVLVYGVLAGFIGFTAMRVIRRQRSHR